MPPLVGIGLPVYNGADTLGRALDSLLGQDFPDLEVLVVDNASTDATPDVARRYAAADPRVRYHRNERNLGLVPNFNLAFTLTSAPYFKWATHDDWVDPSFLDRTVDVLRHEPSAVLCCTGVAVHAGDGSIVERWTPQDDLAGPSCVRRAHRLLWTLGETHQMFGLIRRDALARTAVMGSYLGAARVMLLELALLGPLRQLPDPLYHYTVDDAARSGRSYAVYNDPRNAGQLPLRTWRLTAHQLGALRGRLAGPQRAALSADVVARAVAQDGRLLAAELYRSGEVLARRHVLPSRRASSSLSTDP